MSAKRARHHWLAPLLNTLATAQVVWGYLARVPSALDLAAYEQGHERLPFQERMLLMGPLGWAHRSAGMERLAASFSGNWFGLVTPESMVEAAVDLASVAMTGMIARGIYKASSRTGLLTPFVYPLTLVMIAIGYAWPVLKPVRFVYDLPAMAFFALGLSLIYFRRGAAWFAALFVAATMNRETTLLLLPLYAWSGRKEKWRVLAVVLPLAAWWVGWHLWAARQFAGNASAEGPRLLLNLATLVCPLAWPQLFSAGAYLWPLLFIYRDRIADPALRAWIWLPPAWFVLMLVYGLLVETRIFGELVPYFACAGALIAETSVLQCLGDTTEACHPERSEGPAS